MSKRNFLNSPRLLELRKHRRKIFQNKILLFAFAILVFFSLLVYISRSPSFNIRSVEVQEENGADASAIRTTAEKILAGNYFWLVPKSNILFYPKNDLRNNLYDEFKGITDIKFSVTSGNTLQISLSQRTALYTWCGAVPPVIAEESIEIDQKCYFVDKEGYIYDEAAYFSGDVYFKLYGPANLENGSPSGSYFSGRNFDKLISSIQTLDKMGLEPVALHAAGNGDVKIFLSGKSQPLGPEIIFKIDSDFNKVAENLDAALGTEPLLSDFKNKYSSLLYIDLRFGNKVYFKFK